MQGNNNIFRHLAQIEPSHGLLGSIMLRIMQERQRVARMRVFFLAASALGACGAIVPAVRYAAGELSQSGFYEYVSLAFSDSGALLASWKEFALLLAESLPLAGVTFVLAALLVLLCSIRVMAREIRMAFLLPHIIRYYF